MNTHAYNGSVVSTRNMYITPRNKSLNLPLTFNSSFNFNQTPPDKNTFLSNKSNVKNKKKNSKNKKKKIKNNKQNKSSTLNKFK
jgi:hypothetical protein